MRWISFLAAVAALVSPVLAARAEPDRVGDRWEIDRVLETRSSDGEGSSSESHSSAAIVERVVAVRPDGLELEYDLSGDAGADDRAAQWQWPARIFRPHRGETVLLNAPELETRLEAWLERGKMSRAACGRWIFTWNAFLIECDPQSVLATVRAYDLRIPDLREGGSYREPEARGAVSLARKSSGPDGTIFQAEMELDAGVARRGRAENDVVVAELSGEKVTLAAALQAREKDAVSGTISVTLDMDAAGRVRRLTRVTRIETREASGRVENRTATETLERRLLPARGRAS
jgi:hypothetical protein